MTTVDMMVEPIALNERHNRVVDEADVVRLISYASEKGKPMPFFETSDRTKLTIWTPGHRHARGVLEQLVGLRRMWQYQMVPLSNQGLRCIAYDRRGHGRSDDPGRGYEFDTLADDLAALIAQLDLHDITLVGHSMGCNEIARYLSRHGTSRIARVALIGTLTPFILKTANNPEGVPKIALDQTIAALQRDRPSYVTDGAIKFFGLGSKWPGPPVLSSEMVQWIIRLALESRSKRSSSVSVLSGRPISGLTCRPSPCRP